MKDKDKLIDFASRLVVQLTIRDELIRYKSVSIKRLDTLLTAINILDESINNKRS